MAETGEERTPSGGRIIRHSKRDRPWTPPDMSDSSPEQIVEHIERHLGPIENVFHEIASDLVHVDVHIVPPRPDRPRITLVTTGMSDLPMNVPPGAEAFRYAELLINLPPDWPLTTEELKDENNYWPIRWLKYLARFPHEYDTWLGYGHTVPNGDPPEPFASDVPFSGMLLELPLSAGTEFGRLDISREKSIFFFALVPLYTEEMNLKLQRGLEYLERRFDKHGIRDLVDLSRPNVAVRRKRFP